MRNKQAKSIISMINIDALINILTEVQETGAVYVDIIGIHNTDQDIIALGIRDEYMEDYVEEEEQSSSPLEESDFKDLI